MANYKQLPGTLNLAFNRGDDVSVLIDLNIPAVGYTFTSSIVSAVTGGAVVPFTTTVQSAADGQVNIALTDTQTAALAAGSYRWQMQWTEGNATRTALTGYVEVA